MTQQKHKSSLGTKLVSGGIAGVVGTSIIYPMDFIKTKLQTSHSSGILQVARRTIAESGFLGLYKGLAPNLVGIIPEKAIKLAVNDYCREFWGFRLSVNPDKLPLAYGMLSGAFAGCCQVIVTNPMEIVKIRMQTGQGSSVLSVVRELGLRGLYHHSLATLCRDVPFSFVFFPSVAIFKDWLTKDREPQLWSTFTSGILSGALAAACVTPMDVVKSRLQLKDSPYKNMSDCYRKIIQQEGPKALFKGTLPRVLIVSILVVLSGQMSEPLYSAEQIRIPPELPEILKNYAKFIIKTQPEDIYIASAEYFQGLAHQSQQSVNTEQRLTNLQLEVFFNKFNTPGQELRLATTKEIQSACQEAGISHEQMADVLNLGKWKTEHLSWLRFWTLLVASAAGTLYSTIKLAGDIAGDNGFISTVLIRDMFNFLVEHDKTIAESAVAPVRNALEMTQDNRIEILGVLVNIQEALGKMNAVPTAPKPVQEDAEMQSAQTEQPTEMETEPTEVVPEQSEPVAEAVEPVAEETTVEETVEAVEDQAEPVEESKTEEEKPVEMAE